MSTDPNARIAELEDKLERAYAEINSLSREISDSEYEVSTLEHNIYDLKQDIDRLEKTGIADFVADAIYRRDVLGLDDGDVLSIIHEKLEKSY